MSNLKFDFSGENFVVTGASSGMGRQIAIELAEAGANVLAIARGREALIDLQNMFQNKITIASIDVRNIIDMEMAITNFTKEYGKISGAVHAAGISILTPLRGYDDNEAKKIMDISFWGGVNLVKVCSKVKVSKNKSSFVLFSSVRAYRADKGSFAYSATKAAIKIAVQSFAKEIANRENRINTVSPGWVKTNLTLEQEDLHNLEEINKNHLLGIGKPSDVSGTVLFLLSDRANWITGTDIIVDGGYLA